MRLGEFIQKFSHNNLIRLHHPIKGGQTLVLETWGEVSMDWEVNKQCGVFRHYIDNNVIGLIGIYFGGDKGAYPEAINIIIEPIDNQPLLEDLSKERGNHLESNN